MKRVDKSALLIPVLLDGSGYLGGITGSLSVLAAAKRGLGDLKLASWRRLDLPTEASYVVYMRLATTCQELSMKANGTAILLDKDSNLYSVSYICPQCKKFQTVQARWNPAERRVIPIQFRSECGRRVSIKVTKINQKEKANVR